MVLADIQEMSPDLDSTIQSGAEEAFAQLDLVDLNVILHRADGEERDATGEFPFFFLLHPLSSLLSSPASFPFPSPDSFPWATASPIPSTLPSCSQSPRLARSLPLAPARSFARSLATLTSRRRRSLHNPRVRFPSLLRS